MSLSKTSSIHLAGLALLCLVSWSVQAESDKPCKGKDCSAAKMARTPAASSAAKLNRNVGASGKAVRDDPDELRSKNALKGALKNAPAGQMQAPRDSAGR